MNIQSVGLYSLFSTQNPQLRRDNCVHVPMNKKILQCDTVTFTSVAKSEPLKKLLKFGIPDFYSDIVLVDTKDLELLLEHKVFSKPIRNIVRILKPYEKSLFPIEKQVYRLMKRTARTNPKMYLDEFLHKLVPHHSKILLEQQRPVFEKLSTLALQMPKEQIVQYNKLLDVTNKKLINEPVIVPFSKKELLYKLKRIKERIVQKDNFKEVSDIEKIIKKVEFFEDDMGKAKKPTNKELKQFYKTFIYFENSSLQKDKDMVDLFNATKARLHRVPFEEKFKRKGFIHDLEKIVGQLQDTKLAHKMIQTARELPTSKNSLSAFVVKEANRSSSQIGYDLLADSVGSADHLVAAKAGGDSDIYNYVLASRRYNSERAHSKLSTIIEKDPNVRVYSQNQIDRLIELANSGIFKMCELSSSYILSVARRIKKLSPSNDPLNLDTNKLKY